MPILSNYHHFDGRHYETGAVHNVLAYQGFKAPHTKQPLSEALLMGISGGAVFGYFTFDYKGHDPHIVLLSRNTFDPLDTLLERLAIPQERLQTSDAKKGERNLIEVLESGRPAIVWADIFSLPYNRLPADKNWWGMLPLIVYGYENGMAHIADRSSQPLTVTVDELAKARARVKDDKFRVLALGAPDMTKLSAAVQKGLWQCISLYTEAPPKGARDNFGFAAYEKWAAMLTNTRNKQSWERLFAPGPRMYAALAGGVGQPGAYGWAMTTVADRALYANFLDEAALLLKKPKLKPAGEQFRVSGGAWRELATALLPDDVPLFKETRELAHRKHELFITRGGAALDELEKIDARLKDLKARVSQKFPLTNEQAAALRERLSAHVLKIRDIELKAVELLQTALG